MNRPLSVLIVEDSEDDALLLVRELRQGGYAPTFERVETAEAMATALGGQKWDIVIADYVLPNFSVPAALDLLKRRGLALPFIIVSGAVGEETAVSAMKAGAHDFIAKSNLTRLIPAVERELREAEERRERQRAQRELLESEIRHRTLFENSSDAIVVCDMRGNIITANKATEKLSGYLTEELTKMNMSQITPAWSFTRARGRQGRQSDKAYGWISQHHELQLTRKDGTERTVEAVTGLINIGGQPAQIQALLRDVTEERQAQENVRRYAELVMQAQEDERKRIALELHDETAQDLSRLGLDIDLLISTRNDLGKDVIDRLEELRQRTRQILEGVRRFSQDLRLPVLDDFGLLSALQWLADDLSNQYALHSTVKVVGPPRRVSPPTELALFRIAQEALNNVRKHSEATEVVVRVEFDPEKVKLSVSDNGKGLEIPKTMSDLARLGKLGMLGMQERARLVNGTCSVRSEPDRGTTVTVEVAE
ncbi:MAG: PAS domain S-box protein [Chloroflexi bacterium]|nr:PAS domain S-box protein [Chloroflexota bacterium]